jgi:hypothetical protein
VLSLLSAAGRAFLRAFVAALFLYGLGVLTAPTLSNLALLGVAAIASAFVAALRAIQAVWPGLALAAHLGHPFGDWADAFITAFIASLIVTLPGLVHAPDLNTAKSLAVAALMGALTTAVRAVQGLLTQGEFPAEGKGIVEPRNPYSYALPPRPPVQPQ